MTTPTTAPLSAEQLDKLEVLARAATPGPWDVNQASAMRNGRLVVDELYVYSPEKRNVAIAADIADPATGEMSKDNADFIAAANPAAILALIAQARAAEQPSGNSGELGQTVASQARAAEKAEPVLYARQWQLDSGPMSSNHGILTSTIAEGDWSVPLYTAPQATASPAPRVSGQDERALFEAALRAEYGDEITNDDIDACWIELPGYIWRKARAAIGSASSAVAELGIGVSNNDHGVHISVMQQNADGSFTLLHSAKCPEGDSFSRFTVAPAATTSPAGTASSAAGDEAPTVAWLVEWKTESGGDRRMVTLHNLLAEVRAEHGNAIVTELVPREASVSGAPAEDAKDAARYRWLANRVLACDYGDNDAPGYQVGWRIVHDLLPQLDGRQPAFIYGESIDVAIDTAMAGQQGAKTGGAA